MQSLLEFDILRFMEEAKSVAGSLSDEALHRISDDVRTSLHKQFGSDSVRSFSLRLSNIGQPSCKLWYDKNKPEAAVPNEPTFIFRMVLGDVIEAIFRGILMDLNHDASEPPAVTLDLGDGRTLQGHPDIVIDGKVYDVKSCSRYAWDNKWCSFDALRRDDPFGYIGQLAAYAIAGGYEVGGWWVINKESGQIKLLTPEGMDLKAEARKLAEKYDVVKADIFKRQFDAEEETFYKTKTGNLKLGNTCHWCEYRKDCWPTLTVRESLVSKARVKPIVPYVKIVTPDLEEETETQADSSS